MRRKGEKFTILIFALAIAMILVLPKWRAHQQKVELEKNIAREIAIRKMTDGNALDGPSPAELIANSPYPPLPEIGPLPEVPPRQTSAVPTSKELSDQFARDQLRRDIDSLKRQADLDRMNRDFQRREDERKARWKELQHSLGLDHPQ